MNQDGYGDTDLQDVTKMVSGAITFDKVKGSLTKKLFCSLAFL